MQLTTDIVVKGTGCTPEVAGQWLGGLQLACDKYEVSANAKRLAAFLANVGVESEGLTSLVENMNYSAARLAVVWPFRYAVDPHTVQKMPNETANRIGGNPVLVASNVYANRLGNGPEYTKDGWVYRGQGLIQLTGKAEIQKYFEAAGLVSGTNPAELQTTKYGADSAAWFFKDCGAFAFADQGDFPMTVEKVNGQAPCPENQGDLRYSRYTAALAPLLVLEATPAKTVVKTTATSKPAAQMPPPQA